MVNEKPFSNLSPGVDFDPGEEATHMRNQPREKGDMPIPQSMSQAVKLSSVEARVNENNFPCISNRRVMLKNRPYILLNISNKPH